MDRYVPAQGGITHWRDEALCCYISMRAEIAGRVAEWMIDKGPAETAGPLRFSLTFFNPIPSCCLSGIGNFETKLPA